MVEWYREGTYREAMQKPKTLWHSSTRRLRPPPCPNTSCRLPAPHELGEVFLKDGVRPFSPRPRRLLPRRPREGFPGIDDGDDWNSLFFKALIKSTTPSRSPRPSLVAGVAFSIHDGKEAGRQRNRRGTVQLYDDGLEMANGYTELVDPAQQQNGSRKTTGNEPEWGKRTFPVDRKPS